MIKVNLLPDDVKLEIIQAKKNSELINIFIKTLIVLLFTILLIGFIYFYYKNEITLSSKKLIDKEKSIDQYGNLQEEATKISERINTIKKIEKSTFKWSGLMSEINKVVPTGVYLTGIKMDSVTKNRGQITGYAASKNEVATLRESLEKSKLFEYVDIESSLTQNDPASGLERENFTISLTLAKGALDE